MAGIKRNLKQTLEIRDNASDPRIKLQASGHSQQLLQVHTRHVNQCWHRFRHFQVHYPKDERVKHFAKVRR